MICEHCKQEMNEVFDCKISSLIIEGEKRPRIPYTPPYFGVEYEQCHDCGVINKQFHHPGCDMETCINCNGQLISCDCECDLKGVKISKEVLEQVYARNRKENPESEDFN